MRTIIAASLIGTLALAVPAAPAQTPAPAERHYYITPEQMLEVYGAYSLSNGETLRITREGRRYFASTPSLGKIEIVAIGSIVFVSKDRSVRFAFTPRAFATDLVIDRQGPRAPA